MFGWQPGIGDPSIVGWLTVAAYAAAAAACWLASSSAVPTERRLWLTLAIVMALLCVNKQLDIQTLFTDIGRTVAKAQGWYEQRRGVQWLFIQAIIAAGLVAAVLMLVLIRRVQTPLKMAVAGLALLGTFIIIRAASFEKVDTLLMASFAHARVNHLLELSGIAVVTLGALWSLHRGQPDTRGPRSTKMDPETSSG